MADAKPGLLEVRVGRGMAIPDAKLFPGDSGFLVRYPQGAQYLQAIRNIEQALQAGYEPDLRQFTGRGNKEALSLIAESIAGAIGGVEKRSHVASVRQTPEYVLQPSEVIFDATRHLIEIAGADAVPVVLRNMLDPLVTHYNRGALNFFSLKSHITGYLDPCLGFLKDSNAQEVVHRALRPLLTEYGHGPRQKIIDTILTYRGMYGSMRVERRPMTGGRFEYYGKPFAISGIDPSGEYTISEVEIGVLAVYNAKSGEIEGILDVHPHVYSYADTKKVQAIRLVPPQEAMRVRTGREVTGFREDWQDFFGQYHSFYSDGYGEYTGKSFWADHFFLTLDHPNANYIPFESKYYLWKLLRQEEPQTASVVTDLLAEFGDSMIWVTEALEGDAKLLVPLGTTIKRILSQNKSAHGWTNSDARAFLQALLDHISDTEKFAIDASHALVPPNERSKQSIAERIDFFVPLSRALSREAVISLTRAENLDDALAAAHYHGMAQFELKKSIGFLQSLYARGKIEKEQFDPTTLSSIQEGFALHPNAEVTYMTRVVSWLTHAIFNQAEVSIDERRRTLREFMEYVVFLDVYGKEGARGYAGPSEFEVTRLSNALSTLTREGRIPKNLTILLLGSGPATRVEGPSLDAFRQSLGEKLGLMNIVALDMRSQGANRYKSASFAQGAIEDLPIARGSVDVVILHGSVFNNMTDIGELLRYHHVIAGVLRDGGILIHETGSPVPLRSLNDRYKRMLAFNKIFPMEPFGSIPLIDRYRGFSNDPGFVNALIYEHPLMVVLARLVGLRLLSPPEDPVGFQKLYETLQDPQSFKRISDTVRDAYLAPFTLADPGDNLVGDVNTRSTYIYGQRGTTDPLFSFLLEPAAAAKEKRAAETRSA